MNAITGKIYAITGGNSGIGRATAQILVAQGVSEVARAVVFLLTPDAGYIVGETLVVDGRRSRL